MDKQLQLLIFGWYDEQPNEWKQGVIRKAFLLQRLGGLTEDVVKELQEEYNQWVAGKASRNDKLSG
ncbi:hypothetical protein Q4E40_02640 [Pontibacter sp. BT731]|uniref:hypothetical protein n=1 Tax=Pontibacter coccineus TaxID=3063328 RepID=UPI0026E1B60A|nr:hypothetical protein [Pontibacter sp. BT731]MDO6389010.1 hypothetical protein [Pontibacter sp. BT731]